MHAELVAALESVDPSDLRRWQEPEDLVEPVAETVGQAMYWQAPHDEDALTADPDVTAALWPIATALVCAPAAAWWSSSPDLTALLCTRWGRPGSAGPPPLTGAADRLRRWRAETLAAEIEAATSRPADLQAPFSGHWWSTPPTESVTTARSLPGLGSVELAWHEDGLGLADASIWSLETVRAPRVWEIDGPVAWVDLVERFPMEVTHSRRHDWSRTTGHVGEWLIPDWSAVADEWDAVHVSVSGYLTIATRALPLARGGAATMLAGWNPDQTWWLTDILGVGAGPPTTWHSDEPGRPDPCWHQASE